MQLQNETVLSRWFEQRGWSRSEVLSRLGQPEPEAGTYGKLTGLEAFQSERVHPGTFFFKADKLVLLYISGDAVEDLDPVVLRSTLGEPDLNLRSRAGKTFRHRVWAGGGLAISDDGEELAFVEVFPPMSAAEWQAQYHVEPPAFLK